jgi:hypothetical protein
MRSPEHHPLEVLEQELRGRAWRSTTFGTGMVALTELAYAFLDYRVHGTFQLPVLRVLHVLWSLGVLGVLLARRHALTPRSIDGLFVAAVLPFLPLFAVAEHAMALSGRTWEPMTGHRLVMLAISVLAPTRLWLGGGLIAAFALEAVVLWYALGMVHLLGGFVWEPWLTLVYGGVALGLLGWRVRNHTIELKLRRARADAEALERLARLLLALRDAANTPLQTLELALTLLRQGGAGGNPALLASMERAVHRLRALTQRMAAADALLVWHKGEESFDAESVLKALEAELVRELERRRH